MQLFDHATREQHLLAKIKDWTGERLIGDDCAVLPGGCLVTSDSLVEGTHFLGSVNLEDLGWKAIAVNLSDIAAMGGRPRFAVVNLSFPPRLSDRDIEKLYRGMINCARRFRTRIVGGDLTGGSSLFIAITCLGDSHEMGCLLRSGARAGDIVAVTGDFGASAAGLRLLPASLESFPHLYRAHFRPIPRLCESWAIVRATGSRGALMDSSDGLADALMQLASASRVGIQVDGNAIPVHPETLHACRKLGQEPLELALYGGEDYELVACIPPSAWKSIKASAYNPLVRIGEVTEEEGVVVSGAGGGIRLDARRIYQHWHQGAGT